MAVTKQILKLTNTEAIVKVTGLTTETTTISLDVDLLMATNEKLIITANGYPTNIARAVNIAAVSCYGVPGGYVTIARNSVNILNVANDGLQMVDFQGDPFIPDATQNTSDIVVTVSAQTSQIYIYLKKVAGYKTTDILSTTNS